MPTPISIATLGDLRRYGYALRACCESCHHSARLDLDALIARYGEAWSHIRWRPRLRCTACGSQGCAIMVEVLRSYFPVRY